MSRRVRRRLRPFGLEAAAAPTPEGVGAAGPAKVVVTGLPAGVAALEAFLLDGNGLVVGHYVLPAPNGAAATALPTATLPPGVYLLHLTALDAEGRTLGQLPAHRLDIR